MQAFIKNKKFASKKHREKDRFEPEVNEAYDVIFMP